MRAEAVYRQVQSASEDGEPLESVTLVTQNRLIQELKARYAEIKSRFNKFSQMYKPEHPEMLRLKSQLEEMVRNIRAEVEQILGSLKTEYDVAKAREKSLQTALHEQTRRVQELNDKAIQYRILTREAETNRKMYDTLLERMKEVKLSGGVEKNNITILDYADIQDKPVKPRVALNILLAVVTGLVLGTGLAFLVEYLDTTIKTPEDVKGAVNLPLLASIPRIAIQGDIARDKVALQREKSDASEAYRMLRTQLRFLSPDRALKNLMVTSAAPQEGKTTTLTNLGIMLALGGNKVLVVDADLRCPALHKAFGTGRVPGLRSFLKGESEIEPLLQQTKIDNLWVVSAGRTAPNPSELLDSERMRQFVQEADRRFDFVLYDSPPLVGISDAVILASLMDAVVQIIRSARTPKALALMGKEILARAGVEVVGAVLNDVSPHSGDYYYRYHRYRYEADSEDS